MELHPENGIFSMLNRHNLAVGSLCGNAQTVRERIFINSKRVIARDLSLSRAILKERTVIVKLRYALLAVHEPLCVGYGRAVCRTDSLMSEANAQNGDLTAEPLCRFYYNSRVLRSAGAG